ncbi:MAG: hypothetical protein A3B25_03950 [Candidatus Ryanbacteria bacterium RIFCSPLOWO2_01_FULL_48_26]|uniref:Uncharacterized protein n=1 Tax=Candidatus Ryanbacteria bacterium RIFCSPLOWO2_01_FULL_48_26 TaxID=1802126 RepID=A0A1G2GQU8_9BACT|nr:MAG: hypothetical protein A3B25_03950 [Candidatus Ryanbacteria bacterium RIFCSPLOWO2_01_FULL_48_26]
MSDRVKKSFFIGLYLASVVFLSASLTTHAVNISVNLPGTSAESATDAKGTSPLVFVQQFYNFGLMMGGLLAFAAIVYGGIKYTFAAGNPSGQSEGKEWVKGALLGLLLLAAAYLILETINPSLVKPQLPNL